MKISITRCSLSCSRSISRATRCHGYQQHLEHAWLRRKTNLYRIRRKRSGNKTRWAFTVAWPNKKKTYFTVYISQFEMLISPLHRINCINIAPVSICIAYGLLVSYYFIHEFSFASPFSLSFALILFFHFCSLEIKSQRMQCFDFEQAKCKQLELKKQVLHFRDNFKAPLQPIAW